MVVYYACLSPPWFLGYSVLFSFLFMLASLLIAGFSLSIYLKTYSKNVRLFGVGFLLIALSYLTQAILNLFVYVRAKNGICDNLQLQSLNVLSHLGIGLHLVLMTMGLALLVYVTLKTREPKILALLLIVSGVTLLLSKNVMYAFFLLSTIYLALLTWHFVDNYSHKKEKMTLIIAVAFFILTLGWIGLLFIPYSPLFYILGSMLHLSGFGLIFWNYTLVRRP